MSDERAREVELATPDRRQVLIVNRLYAGLPAGELLEEGDVVLQADGDTITRFEQLELKALAESVELMVLRDGEEMIIEVPTHPLTGEGVERVVTWAGVLLHEPHFDLATQLEVTPGSGVYVSFYWYGSPAARYGLRATRRIAEVNGTETPDLDSFLAAVGALGEGEPVRLKILDLDGQAHIRTMKLDNHYWPTDEYRLTEGGWQRTRID